LIRFAGSESARALKAEMLHVKSFLRRNVTSVQRNVVETYHATTGFDIGPQEA
jgi:hypothetical protein